MSFIKEMFMPGYKIMISLIISTQIESGINPCNNTKSLFGNRTQIENLTYYASINQINSNHVNHLSEFTQNQPDVLKRANFIVIWVVISAKRGNFAL